MNGSALLLAFHFPPENNIASARPYRFYKHLPRFGYDVRVVTASAQDGKHGMQNVLCALNGVRSPWRRLWQSALLRLLAPLVAKDSLCWAIGSYEAAKELITRQEMSVILSTSPPIISNVVAGLLKERHGIPWVADFRDPVVGNPERSRTSSISRLRDRVVERWSFRRADILIANTDAALDMWKRKYPGYASKMHLIWNGFDREDPVEPMPIPQREFRLLVHAGGISESRHPGILLSSLRRLSRRGELSSRKVRIRLVGRLGKGWARDAELVEELVRFGYLEYDDVLIPRDEAKMAMTSADSLLLVDLLPVGESVQVPGKVFEYVRVGRPVLAITTRCSPTEHLLSLSGIRYTSIYPDDTAEEVDRKVLHFLTLPTEPIVANECFWNEFEATAQTRQLASLIASLGQADRTDRASLQSVGA